MVNSCLHYQIFPLQFIQVCSYWPVSFLEFLLFNCFMLIHEMNLGSALFQSICKTLERFAEYGKVCFNIHLVLSCPFIVEKND